MAYLKVSPLGSSHEETWRGQGIRKRSVSWNLPKLSQMWLCNGGFGPCTTQNHLRTKQFVSGTWNSSRVAACALRNEQTGRAHMNSSRVAACALRNEQAVRAYGRDCRACARKLCEEPTEVNTSRQPGIADVSVKCLANSAQTSSREKKPAAGVAGTESPVSQSSFTILRGFPTSARGKRVCWEAGFQWWGEVSCVW